MLVTLTLETALQERIQNFHVALSLEMPRSVLVESAPRASLPAQLGQENGLLE
jgi:hypothetical protein